MDSTYPQLILVKGDGISSPNSFEDPKPQTDSETDPKQISITHRLPSLDPVEPWQLLRIQESWPSVTQLSWIRASVIVQDLRNDAIYSALRIWRSPTV